MTKISETLKLSFACSLTAFLVIISSEPTLAGPDDLSKWLIDEPASMLDIGMLRLELELSDVDMDQTTTQPTLKYNWDKDEIEISAFLVTRKYKFTTEHDVRAFCGEWFRAIRDNLLINSDTGGPMIPGTSAHSYYAPDQFTHRGFTRGKQKDEDFHIDLSKKFTASLFAHYYGDNGHVNIKCFKELYEKSFSFEVVE